MVIKTILMLLSYIRTIRNPRPVNSLHKKSEPINLKDVNWTFILMTLAIVIFFVVVFVKGIGNEYPNDLMSGSLDVWIHITFENY